MRRSRVGSTPRLEALAALLPALAAAGCGDAGPEPTLVIDAPVSTEVVVGDELRLSVTVGGGVLRVTWSSDDESVATVFEGRVEALRPGTVTITASADGALPSEITLTVVPRPGGYTADEIDYFTEIAFGAEFGTATPLLRRWLSGPLIDISGAPTQKDLEVVDSVLAEINRIVPSFGIGLGTVLPEVEMHFVPQADFTSVLPQAPPNNNGIVWLWWGADQYLFQSVVLISTDAGEATREHIIREELTQMLGLLKDSFVYPLSIFYQNPSSVTEYQPIDRIVIELLHRPELDVGMTLAEAAKVARTLTRASPWLAASAPSRLPRYRPFRGQPGSAGSGAFSRTRSPLPRAAPGASR